MSREVSVSCRKFSLLSVSESGSVFDVGTKRVINALTGDFGFTDLAGRRICLARFDHLKHRMVVLLVGEFARNAPALMKIEFYGHGVRLHDSEAARLVTARSDLRFTLREQFPANAMSAVFAKHP